MVKHTFVRSALVLIAVFATTLMADKPAIQDTAQMISKPEEQAKAKVLELFSASPVVFIENTGQIADSTVRFAFYGNGANIFHTTNGPVFQLFKRDKVTIDGNSENGLLRPHHRQDEPKDFNTIAYTFSANFVGAKNINPTGAQGQQTKVNYFIGNDPNKWHTGVTTYAEVIYPQIYEGIELHTFGKRNHLKYEFHVAPGADFSQILIRYEGIEGLSIDSKGKLHVQTLMGELIDNAPVIWQIINGKKVEIPGRHRLIDKTSYTFEITSQINQNAELIIDPDLAWTSYLGGSDDDCGYSIAVDSSGNVFLTGVTYSTDFPVQGGFDTNFNGGYCDIFVAKVTNSGTLSWASYLGGNGYDYGSGVAVDSSGNVFLTGLTDSTDFPVGGGFDTSHNGSADVFVAKITNSGQLSWASYLGGSRDDWGRGVAVDYSGNVFLTGYTISSNFPTPGGFDTSYNGSWDAFVAKVTNSGQLAWASYLGGNDYEEGRGVAVDSSENVFLTGYTSSSNFPVPGGFDTSLNGGSDVFVAKITNLGQLSWASYLGGNDYEEGRGVAVDSWGNVFLTGYTDSTDFPVPGGCDTTYKGYTDVFVAKVTNSGILSWASYLGGSGEEGVNEPGEGLGIAVDSSGDVFLTGKTDSTDFPVPGGFDSTYNGNTDVFVAKVTNSGTLSWASYLGGSRDDWGCGVAVDSSGNVFLTGITGSEDFPVPGGFNQSLDGYYDVFVAKISDDDTPPQTTEFIWQRIILDESYNNWAGTYEVRVQSKNTPQNPGIQIYPSIQTNVPDPQRIIVKGPQGNTITDTNLLRIVLSYAHNAAIYRGWATSEVAVYETKPQILDVLYDCQMVNNENFGYLYPGTLYFPKEFDPQAPIFSFYFFDNPIEYPPILQAGIRNYIARKRCYYSIIKNCFLQEGVKSCPDEAAIGIYGFLKNVNIESAGKIQKVADSLRAIDKLYAGGTALPQAIRVVLKSAQFDGDTYRTIRQFLHAQNNYLGIGKKMADRIDNISTLLGPTLSITGNALTALALADAAEGHAAKVSESLKWIVDNPNADPALRDALTKAQQDLQSSTNDLMIVIAEAIRDYALNGDATVDAGEFILSLKSAGWTLARIFQEDFIEMVGAFQEVSLDTTWNNVFFYSPMQDLAKNRIRYSSSSNDLDELNALLSLYIYQQYFYANGLLGGDSLLYQYAVLPFRGIFYPHFPERKMRLAFIQSEAHKTYWGIGSLYPFIAGRQEINGKFIGFVPEARLDRLIQLTTVGNAVKNNTKITIAVFSPVDLLLIDPVGRNVGSLIIDEFDGNSVTLNQIPDATYSGPEEEPEIITINDPLDGTYNVKLIGTGTGPFTFVITAEEDGNTVFSQTTEGIIEEGKILDVMVNITSSENTFAVNATEPNLVRGTIKGIVLNKLTSEPISGANVRISDLQEETITDANGSFNFGSVLEGNYFVQSKCSGYEPSESVTVQVEPNQTCDVTLFLKRSILANKPPVANAGPNQTVYAWIDGVAEVNLNGSGSYDDDNNPLIYKWTWTIDANVYEVNSVMPSIELPVGQYVISLIVNDGTVDSEPNEVVITVIGPVEANLNIMTKVLNCKGFQPRIMATLRLPKGITKDQIDSNEPILLYPGEIEADWTWISRDFDYKCRVWNTTIFASFDKDELMDAIDDNGQVELVVVGQLKTGQYFFGTDNIRVISPGHWPWHRPWWNYRWNRWHRGLCNSHH